MLRSRWMTFCEARYATPLAVMPLLPDMLIDVRLVTAERWRRPSSRRKMRRIRRAEFTVLRAVGGPVGKAGSIGLSTARDKLLTLRQRLR